MTEQELQAWRKETLKMAQPIMERLDRACPYFKVVISPRGARLIVEEAFKPNPKYDPRNSPISEKDDV